MAGRKRRSGSSGVRRKNHTYPRGIIEVNPKGFAFVKTAEGEFFIPSKYVSVAFDGDLVEVSFIPQRKCGHRGENGSAARLEARVIRVIQRAHAEVVGTYHVASPFGVVVPDDPRIKHDIFTLLEDFPGIEDGSLVCVEIIEFPNKRTAATGRVVEVLGATDDIDVQMQRIIAKNKLDAAFSEAALEQAKAAKIDVYGALADGYVDLRDRFVLTIDPVDAKDFDDAISLDEVVGIPQDANLISACTAQLSSKYLRLGVHIADVSNYVPASSPIDVDAKKKATSVYLVDRVLPMIPPELSDDLCSLKPNEDRLSMTVDAYLDDKFNVVAYCIYPAVIKSNLRLNYDEALKILNDEGASLARTHSEALIDTATPKLHLASRFAQARQLARGKTGGIDFNTTEAKVRLDKTGAPVGIDIRRRTLSTELIEEAMILANELVATHLLNSGIPCAFRNHERPQADALGDLIEVFSEFDWYTNTDGNGLLIGSPFAIQSVLKKAKGRPEEQLVTSLILRSMSRALYDVENLGHYGLGLDVYCHFTSPIRRYPDLLVHRALKDLFAGKRNFTRKQLSELKFACEHSSKMERVAEEASRQSQELKIAEYMQQFVGQDFSGVISGVANYGLYVTLENTAEGFLPVKSLGDDYYIFEYKKHQLRGCDTRKIFRLGQRVAVTLVAVDDITSSLEFSLVKQKRRQKKGSDVTAGKKTSVGKLNGKKRKKLTSAERRAKQKSTINQNG